MFPNTGHFLYKKGRKTCSYVFHVGRRLRNAHRDFRSPCLGLPQLGRCRGRRPVLFGCTAAPVSIILGLRLSRSNTTAPFNAPPTSNTLFSTRRDTEYRSTWKLAALSGSCKLLGSYLRGAKFRTFSDFRKFSEHKALKGNGIVGGHNEQGQRWVEDLTAIDCTLEHRERKNSANGNADLLSRLSQSATGHDWSGPSRLTPLGDGAEYLTPAGDLRTHPTPQTST